MRKCAPRSCCCSRTRTRSRKVAEGAGAASLAGLLALRETLAGSKAGIVVTGGNASPAELTTVLAGAPAAVA
jgi:threonine dehydratase